MPGRGHYEEAEYLLGRKDSPSFGISARFDRAATTEEVAKAQVHATLALTDVLTKLLAEMSARRGDGSGS
jgi:hypothetical protein